MTRFDRFSDFMHQYAYQSYYPDNVFAISENLERADRDNCLYQFFMNQSPYRSAFPLMTSDGGARGKDQVAIVFALNIYGGDHPGFVHRLNRVLKQLAAGSGKEQEAVMVLMRAQMELQQMEISLINFVDHELLQRVSNNISSQKGLKITLYTLLLVGGALGAPGFSMSGFVFMLPFCVVAIFLGLFKLIYWACIRQITPQEIQVCARPLQEYSDLTGEQRKQAPAEPVPQPQKGTAVSFCTNCGTPVRPEDAFCLSCGTRLR